MKKRLAVVLLMATFSLPMWAHGDMDHILGTVSKITGEVVTVSKDGKDTDVYLRGFTKYELAGQVGMREQLKVGDRVVVHAKKSKDNKEEAYDVRFMHPQKN